MDKDTELFKGKSFADIMSDVYHNSKKKDRQLKLLIAQLEPLVKNLQDATVIVPLIKEYMEVSIKNDEQIVKLVAIVQRMLKDANSSEEGGFGLSEDEKKQLLENAKEIDNKIDALSSTEGEEYSTHNKFVVGTVQKINLKDDDVNEMYAIQAYNQTT